MPPDIRAACERLRRWRFNEPNIPDDELVLRGSTEWKDAMLLAEAYIAEHPADDDEPVTYDQLEEMFRSSEFTVGQRSGKLCMVFDGDVELRTRGDVRRLCAAFGIETKELQPCRRSAADLIERQAEEIERLQSRLAEAEPLLRRIYNADFSGYGWSSIIAPYFARTSASIPAIEGAEPGAASGNAAATNSAPYGAVGEAAPNTPRIKTVHCRIG